MDAFEQVRESAVRLHDELVAQGADTLKPMALVDAAIRKLKLELAWLAADDPILKGARAIFDQQTGTVCCETVGEPGERALLVAHELGHAYIHGSSSSCNADDVDASRSTEAAPVGLQRVEDYGVRERRELQANVFAREFLLPRPLARRLFVEDGLAASAICERTGLPKSVVRQQIFDAILLPPDTGEAETGDDAAPPHRPDESQDRAAAHRGSPFQLQAGPGTGKTRTLVKRALSLLAEGIDPAAILILTYSNRAAGELVERISAAAPEDAPRIWVGTFHAFGLEIVRRYHDRLGLPANPALFDRSDAVEVLQDLLPTLPLTHYRNLWDPAMELREVVTAISRAKDEMTGPERYRALAQAMFDKAADDDARVAAEKCLEVADIYDHYERAVRKHGAVDFGDLIMRPAMLLEADPALRAAMQLRHRHVLVDEYQDVNRASAKLLRAVSGDGKRLWTVGDSRQSIYRFRGASSLNMAAFPREYAGATADRLEINYRSIEQIVSAFVGIAPRMGASEGMLPLVLSAERGRGPGPLEIRRYGSFDDEVEGVAASVRELEASGVKLRDQAVLCRTNGRLNEIAEGLVARGIPVLHLGSLFERDEIRDLLALMSLAVDPFGDGITRVGTMARYGVSLQDVYETVRRLHETKDGALRHLAVLSETKSISPTGGAGFAQLARDLNGIAASSSAWEFLATYLLDRTDLLRDLARRSSVQDCMRGVAIWQFLNFVREQSPIGHGLPIQRTLDRVRQLLLLAEERDLRQVPAAALHMDAVRLMTVHGSKGLEFEGVHIAGLTVMSFPSRNQGQRCPAPVGMIEGADGLMVSDEAKRAHEHEEQCLFFVALSRARTHLRLHLAKTQRNGNARSPSPFLEWISRGMAAEIARPAQLALPPDAPQPTPIPVTYPAGWQISHSRFGLYERCPRRFFYTHILGLGNARKATAFSRTHDCVYELIRWLAGARREGDPTVEAAEAAFESIWQARGPIDHAYAADYRKLGSRLIKALIRSGAGRRYREAEPLAIDFARGRVIVEPDEMAELPDGAIVLRRIRTGYKRSDEYDKLEYTLYQLAGHARFGRRFVVEALHLSDEVTENVTITAKKVSNRRDNSEEMMASIAAGWFAPKVDAVSCPRCPHFFVCAATPGGPLAVR